MKTYLSRTVREEMVAILREREEELKILRASAENLAEQNYLLRNYLQNKYGENFEKDAE